MLGSPQASPRKVQNSSNDCISPNGFQALQDIREEGEIEDDEETEEVEVPDSASLIVESLPVVVVTNETSVTAQRHGGSQRNKGRGAKRGIVNSRDLVQAVTQQQKANKTAADRGSIREFQNVVHNCDLMDIAQVGPSFTWTNCQDENPISKKLDRVMVNSCWISALPNSFVTFESGGVYDHLRMHIQLREVPQGNAKRFKFFNHKAF
ncbi:hypothetical protein IGI04_014745 [Brassica rapa subsp. trilocularis]|uniref:Uncharacterized protein n=1 Tax=Brassica rapa subsp. trilocularis TaxID=1813537 RepID=A0ABQ7MPK5_BRACM|nr:hypothetical protein IGI04_014745 [Brassica rapa subsp. trilocularis]